ncbi:hypothetical protein GALMADRAFT_250656 [Galerina marginata CBS 339.88]|uniref:Uncharacterized protein n=1 Tax=Galerina marginata (strain CBS 339.88) TaxID=685588 RepID=A0A067SSW0_GALM3|nr:hypothetical protein GALMADRAFT_250656 [Galerina marginata CBS 339.88]
MLSQLVIPSRLEALVTEHLRSIGGLFWVVTIIMSIVFCGMTRWHPCAVMSRLQHSLSPRSVVPIPGAVSACRKIMALDVLIVMNACSLVAFAVSNPREEESTSIVNQIMNTANSSSNNDEVDLGELAHYLDAIENV